MDKPTFTKFKDITPADIKKWKQTKGKLKQIEIPLNEDDIDGKGEKATFIICAPTRNILSAIATYGQDKNIDKVNEILINNCVLGGDMKFLDEDSGDTSIFLSVLDEVGKLMEKKRVISNYI